MNCFIFFQIRSENIVADIYNIKKILTSLKGKKLQYICRSCELIDIGFGDLISKKNHKNKEYKCASFSLHIQCPFRISVEDKILTGSDDLFVSNSNSQYSVDLSKKKSTLFDIKAEKIMVDFPEEYVDECKLDECVDLFLFLSNIKISLFVTGSENCEAWRFLNDDVFHIVVSGNDIELQ